MTVKNQNFLIVYLFIYLQIYVKIEDIMYQILLFELNFLRINLLIRKKKNYKICILEPLIIWLVQF